MNHGIFIDHAFTADGLAVNDLRGRWQRFLAVNGLTGIQPRHVGKNKFIQQNGFTCYRLAGFPLLKSQCDSCL
ncbi:hypothetical protein G9G00_18925 [Enterobacter hormaechei]|nr:hypothetical protein G9G00_18925 [Enterobacter hormaechei]KAF6532561.1 hypothetical protein G9G11_19365 [Enterobacter hormaechei]